MNNQLKMEKEKKIYELPTNDFEFIKAKAHSGDLQSLKLIFDLLSFSFMYKIKYT